MGDGGVACMSSQIDVERFPASEKLCGVGDLEQKMRELDKIKDSSALERGSREVVDEKLNGVELEKGEFVSSPATDSRGREGEVEKSGGEFQENAELENGEFVPDEWRKRELEKGEFVPDICRNDENEKCGKNQKVELEKGEFVPDSKWRSHDRNPEAHHHRGDLDQRNVTSGRFDDGFHERRGDTTTSKHDSNSNGKIHENDSISKDSGRSGTFIKRTSMESKLCGSKHYTETTDRSGSKSRRISEDNNYSHSRHHGRYYRNSTAASLKASSTTRYSSSRHNDSNLRSRSHSKHRRSPDGRMEWSSSHRNHEHRNHSSLLSVRSPHELNRHHDFRERSSGLSEKSPLERTRRHDYKDRPSYEWTRRREQKERNPGHLEHSHNCNGSLDHREANRGHTENKHWTCDNKTSRRDSSSKNPTRDNLVRQSSDSSSCPDKTAEGMHHNEKESNDQSIRSSEPPLLPPPLSTSSLPSPLLINGAQEELPSMEEDMDICTTPPHTFTSKLDTGKWYYLDHFGNECGPSKLMDLKRLVEEGVLLSDHLIKHLDSDRWVTVENAASPLVYRDMHSVVLDTLTQTASHLKVPENLLSDAEEFNKRSMSSVNEDTNLDELQIDERVEALLEGCVVIPGKEIEIIGGALNSTFVHAELDSWERSEGFTRFQVRSSELPKNQRDDESSKAIDIVSKENPENRLSVPPEKECSFICGDSTDWFAGRWPCKGGDWKRNEDASQDRSLKRKLVLSEGYPLCQMPKCGYEDPRWKMRDDLHHASYSKKLDLPSWAYTYTSADEKSDNSAEQNKNTHTNKIFQAKTLSSRGTKGTMLAVIRINARVMKDHKSSVSEPRLRAKSKDRHSLRSMRSHSGGSDKNSVTDGNWSKRGQEYDLHSDHKFKYSINIPSDHVRTRDELALHLGEWYYMDGAGRELGPYMFSELKDLVSKNAILEHSIVFRKVDNIWVQISKTTITTESIQNNEQTLENVNFTNKETDVFFPFHDLHPQFIGFMRGKLHELIMKSYKSREFAAAINGVLDPWLNANQPKEIDKHFSFKSAKSSVFSRGLSGDKFQRSEEDYLGLYNYSAKRARLINDGSNDDCDMDPSFFLKEYYSFEDLCTVDVAIDENFSAQSENWGLLNYRILGRIFYFLRDDTKSLLFSAATCKHWKRVVGFYKGISKYVDFSSAGPNLCDNMFQNIMKGYDCNKITTVILAWCTEVSSSSLEEVIRSFPCISTIDIRGCNQFRELVPMFQHVRWIESQNSFNIRYLEDPYSKARRLKQITEKSYSIAKSLKASSSYFENFNDDSGNFGSNSIVMGRKDSSNETFNKQSYYKRTKLLDARKSSGALSRDAQFKQLIRKRSADVYRNMEPLITNSLKSIMKENTFEFLVPKVEEIQDRMKNGYYALHGLNYVQNDIRKMCRIIIKANKQSDMGDLKKIKSSFLQLVERLENSMKSNERNTVNGSHGLFFSEDAKIRRKQSNTLHGKKYLSRNSNTSHDNSGYKNGNYKFGHDIKKSFSKFKKRYTDSETETSDDGDLFEDGMSESESTESDTESDSESRYEAGMGNQDGFLLLDDATNTVEEREWGARMTKASLVPPVTRKYESIDRYIAVADEGEVEKKMSVSLPDDYVEKLRAQSDGVEEMEIPEVKNYKPRKMLEKEVIEQEVYGIDPYTHNLLLDSIPKDMQWSLSDMHDFIEDVLLRTLNKQVYHFTGSGNAPMVYSLQNVIEEIKKKAEEDDGDINTMKICHSLLKNMRSRSVENYVAYRKGLGVVCNKENGFPKDDFVVEFLGEVYPAWKWYEKQDGIRSLQKNSKEPLPEFYNINLERPKGDGQGYDLVVVDAMHKANYASRICHSCKPNCEAKVTAVDGHYQIGVYTLKPIAFGEEITFDYNSVTESKDEYEASVCLCGSQVCRGSFLNLTGEEAYQNVLKECHGMLDRHKLMLKACEANSVSEEDYLVLGRAGLGTCLLADLPDWLIAYSAHLVRFINFERKKLPEEILKLNGEEKMKYIPNYNPEDDKIDAQIQAEGVYNQRLQNMAITIDKVKYVMRNIFGNPKLAPPPLEKLSPEAVASALWKGDGSLIDELLKCLAVYMEIDALNNLKSKIRLHDPSGSDDVKLNLKKSLLWLRDEIRDLPCSQKCRNDAAADLIHMYAHTKSFFKVKEYESFTSPPVYISPLDMGPKYMEKMSSGFQEYRKTYGKNYCFSQLIYWHNQTNSDPDSSLLKSRRGCLVLPDISSFYFNNQKSLRKHVYGVKTLREMLRRMEKQSQRQWPRDAIWEFRSVPNFFGSPMFDAVLTKSRLDSDMVQWLKNRPAMFQGARDG